MLNTRSVPEIEIYRGLWLLSWFVKEFGTHGVMYRAEFVRKLGEEIVENYEVHNHNLFFNHVLVGNTTNNVPVEINADVMSADYKIAIGTTMAHAVVFAEHTVKGMRDPWYIDEHSGAEYVKTWNDALRTLDDGTPKKVVLYPNAECQVLDNSKQFYKQGK